MSIVFKAKTKEKCEEKIVLGFCFKTHTQAFLGVNGLKKNFLPVLALKTKDPQMFLSIFFKMH